MKYAIVDIGSNTIRMIVYQVEEGKIQKVLSEKQTAGLVGYINKHGELAQDGIDTLVETLRQFLHTAETIGVDEFHAFATASLRSIENQEQVLKTTRDQVNITIRILSGEEEAALDFTALRDEIGSESGLMIDLGGGSVELVQFINGVREMSSTISFGSLSLYKTFVEDILPTERELKEIKKHVKERIEEAPWLTGCAKHAYLLGGTGRAMAKLYMKVFDAPGDVHGYTMDPHKIKKLRKAVLNESMLLIRNCPERIHTILPGITALRAIIKAADCEQITVYNLGIREGYLKQYVLKRGGISEHTRI